MPKNKIESDQEVSGKLFGYARVSTEDQNLDMQIQALEKAGCEKIFSEKRSTSRGRRPAFERMLKTLRKGDTVVIWKIDRLFRSLSDMLKLHEEFEKRGIGLHCIQDQLDTSTPMGKFFFHLLSAVAELERNLISQRTKAGIAARRARGERVGGRSKIKPENYEKIKADILNVDQEMKVTAKKWKVTVSTLNNHFPGVRTAALAKAGIRTPPKPKRKPGEMK